MRRKLCTSRSPLNVDTQKTASCVKDAAFKVLSWKQRLGPHQMLNLLSTLIFHFTFIRTAYVLDRRMLLEFLVSALRGCWSFGKMCLLNGTSQIQEASLGLLPDLLVIQGCASPLHMRQTGAVAEMSHGR
nr:uncharacterized protein LOC105477528 isoform X2 [Macaca nemestrina]